LNSISSAASCGSGLCFFLAIFQILSYQIFSHFTWYKTRRSRHLNLSYAREARQPERDYDECGLSIVRTDGIFHFVFRKIPK